MKPTQGVILIMIAALLLYLTWSSRSVLRSKPEGSKAVGNTDQNIAGSKCPDGTTEHFVGATRYCLPNSTGVLSKTTDGLIRA